MNPAANARSRATFDQGIPLAAFETSDIQADEEPGSRVHPRADASGAVMIAVFSDTCGNLFSSIDLV